MQIKMITTKQNKPGAVIIIDVANYVKDAKNSNSKIKTLRKSFKMTQHRHIQDWSMTQWHVSKILN